MYEKFIKRLLKPNGTFNNSPTKKDNLSYLSLFKK